MKIAMVGGRPETDVNELARELGRQGHQVTVHVRRDSPEGPDRVRHEHGVVVDRVTAGPARPLHDDETLPHLPEFGRRLAERWERSRPDVVHAHCWLNGLAALAGARDLGLPVVQTYHSLGVVGSRQNGTGHTPRIRLERAIGRTADAVIAGCADEAAELLRMGVPRPRIGIVPGGVDAGRFRPDGPADPRGDAHRLLTLSRAGADTAIAALGRIPRTELVVAGGPPREELDGDPEVHRLRRLAEQGRVADRVTFVGTVPRRRLPGLLRSSDLVLTLPSYGPAEPVPLEAMACGVPVVATEVGGHAETIIHNVTGMHVRPRQPVELARLLRGLLADPTRRHAMGIAGSDRARARYSWERIARETAELYAGVAESRAHPAEPRP